MARLNRETFGRRGPTNVIAFPMDAEEFGRGGQGSITGETPVPQAPPQPTPPTPYGDLPGGLIDAGGPPPILGEVVISVETTRRQALETGWDWEELLDFFLIHGILHLLGYDHEDPESLVRMDAKTWELMGLLYPDLKDMEQ